MCILPGYCLFFLIYSFFEHIGVILICFYTHCAFGSNIGDILFNRDGNYCIGLNTIWGGFFKYFNASGGSDGVGTIFSSSGDY